MKELPTTELEVTVDDLSREELAELEEAIAEYEANPDAGIPWEEAKAKLLGGE